MKDNKIKPSILPGFMELLPSEQIIFEDIVKKIRKVYEESGCLPMDTPIIEKSEVLLAKSAGETEKQVYRFNKGKNDLSLRFDLTVPLSRYVAQYYNELTFPFKRYQIGKVYRGERNQKGRYREFYQCDLDIIGNGKLSIDNDGFVISVINKAFKAIGLENFKFQISNRKILTSVLKYLNIENDMEVLILIDKYEKISISEFNNTLISYIGAEKADIINKIMNIDGSNKEILKQLKEMNINDDTYLKGINELERVLSILKILGVYEKNYKINLKIIRGLDYYTGTVVETVLEGNEQYGSICSGGRYDNLAQNYTKNILPGVGISIGLTRLFFVLKEIGFLNNYKVDRNERYLIIPIGDTLEACGLIKNKLEKEEKSVEIYFENTKLKKIMDYANKASFDKVIIVGEDEIKSGEFMIRNMKNGQVEKITL